MSQGKLICSRCGKEMGASRTAQDSHGICKRCLKTLVPDKDRRRSILKKWKKGQGQNDDRD